MVKKQKVPKQRNPFVQHLMNRKSGSHEKSKKVERQKIKVNLRKEWLNQVTSEM